MPIFNHGLTESQLKILLDILAPYGEQIGQVKLFGSRAQGTSRDNSDIDMVVYGDISDSIIDRLGTLFNESLLPISVDIIAYQPKLYPPLKRHIDTFGRVLFTQDELQNHVSHINQELANAR